MKNKFLSCVLAFSMMVAFVPSQAFADETAPPAVSIESQGIGVKAKTSDFTLLNESKYHDRTFKQIDVYAKPENFKAAQSVQVSLQASNGKYYDENSGMFVLDNENMLTAASKGDGVYTFAIPQPVYMTMPNGNYTVHYTASDVNGAVLADSQSVIKFFPSSAGLAANSHAASMKNIELYPLRATAIPSADFLNMVVTNGKDTTPVFVEQQLDDYPLHNVEDGYNYVGARYHVARLSSNESNVTHVTLTTKDNISNALVRPARLVKNVEFSGKNLSFDIVNTKGNHDSNISALARNIVVSVTTDISLGNTLPDNADPKYNQKNYAYFHILMDDLEKNKPVIDGIDVLDITAIDPSIDRTGISKVTKNLNDIFVDSKYAGKTLYIPNGVYLCGALVLPTLPNTKVYLDSGATILGTDNAADYPTDLMPTSSVTNAGDRYFEWGTDYGEVMSYSRQIFIDKADGVTLFGRGTINANGFHARFDIAKNNPAGYSGIQDDGKPIQTMRIKDSKNITIQDIYIRNSPAWTVHALRDDNLSISGVKITNEFAMNSTDGFDIDSSTHVTLDKCFYYGSDDAFVMKGTGNSGGRIYTTIGDDNSKLSDVTPDYVPDKYLNRTYQLYAGPTAYVVAKNSTLIATANSANAIGTEANNVSIHDITFQNNDSIDSLLAVSIRPRDDAEIYNIKFIGNIYDRPAQIIELGQDLRGWKYNVQKFGIQGGAYGNQKDVDYVTTSTSTANTQANTNPKAKALVPWFDRSGSKLHDISFEDNTVSNFNFGGMGHGFIGQAINIRGAKPSNDVMNNLDKSNLMQRNTILNNLTFKNFKFVNASIYEQFGYTEEHAYRFYEDGDFMNTTNLIARVDNAYWGSPEFANQMPNHAPMDTRTITNLDVYSDVAPSATIITPKSDLSNFPNRVDDKYMQMYFKRRVLNSANDLKNIEVLAVPARGKALQAVYVTILSPNGKYVTVDGGFSSTETPIKLTAKRDGIYTYTLPTAALKNVTSGQYTLQTYAIGDDGTKSGIELKNFVMAIDNSKPLPPINVKQQPYARTDTTIDVKWEIPADYKPGDVYTVYARLVRNNNSYLINKQNYTLKDGAKSVYTNFAFKPNTDASVKSVQTTGTTARLTGLNAASPYVIMVTTTRNGVESPVSDYTIANTRFNVSATVNITAYGASTASPDNTAAIQKAIDSTPKNGVVVVPAGTFVTGAIFLKDNITLQLNDGAELKAFTDFSFGAGSQEAIVSQYYPEIVTPTGTMFASLVNLVNNAGLTTVNGVKMITDPVSVVDTTVRGVGTLNYNATTLAQALAYATPANNVYNFNAILAVGADGVCLQDVTIKDTTTLGYNSTNSINVAVNGLKVTSNATLPAKLAVDSMGVQ
jgi:polygalacturonase